MYLLKLKISIPLRLHHAYHPRWILPATDQASVVRRRTIGISVDLGQNDALFGGVKDWFSKFEIL